MKEKNQFMDVTMISQYIHVAKSTIYKWVSENSIPYVKLRKRTLFVKERIDQWVLSGGVIEEDLPELPISKAA